MRPPSGLRSGCLNFGGWLSGAGRAGQSAQCVCIERFLLKQRTGATLQHLTPVLQQVGGLFNGLLHGASHRFIDALPGLGSWLPAVLRPAGNVQKRRALGFALLVAALTFVAAALAAWIGPRGAMAAAAVAALVTGFANDRRWHHVAVRYEFGKPESIRGWIDGKEIKGSWDMDGETTDAPVVDDAPVWIGSSMGGLANSSFRGAIDDIRLYRTLVPAAEIAARFATTLPPVAKADIAQVGPSPNAGNDSASGTKAAKVPEVVRKAPKVDWTTVTDGLYQPTRRHRAGRSSNAGLFGLSAREVYPRPWLPIARTDS